MALAYFAIRRQFNKLTVSLFVQNEHKEAEVVVTYDRRIVHSSTVRFTDVDSVEKAEAWLRQPTGNYATLLESLEAKYRAEAVS